MPCEQQILDDMIQDFMTEVDARHRRELRELESRDPDTLTKEEQKEVELLRAQVRRFEQWEGGGIVH